MYAVPIVTGIIGTALSVYQGMEMLNIADDQEDIAKRNADREKEEAKEQARRERKEMDATEAEARARGAASGMNVDKSKSQVLFLANQKTEHARQIDWIRKSAKSRAKIIKREGDLEARKTRAGAWGKFGAAATSALGAGATGYEWYKTT